MRQKSLDNKLFRATFFNYFLCLPLRSLRSLR